jgi:mono/diheme cytochrome c family protein
MTKSLALTTLLLATLLLSACALSGDITPPPGSVLPEPQKATQTVSTNSVFPIVPPDLTKGAEIYNRECVQCHGTRGLGDGPQAAQLSGPVATLGLSDFARQYSPAAWYSVVKQGNLDRFMPAFGNLTDRQRWDVVAYAMSLSSSEELIQQGRSLFLKNCVECHGQGGKGNGSKADALTSRPADFSNQAFMAQRSSQSLYQAVSAGIAPDMPAYTSTLSDNDRYALVAYLRSLTYTVSPTTASPSPAPASTEQAATTAYPNLETQTYPNPLETETPLPAETTVVTPTTFVGSVSVELVNGSGGVGPSDAPVTLYGFDDMQNTYSQTLSTGTDGIYQFTDVVMPEGRAFLAAVEYASTSYGSDVVMVDPATPDLNLLITVYDSTTDVSVLTTDRVHLLFDFSTPDIVNVVEVFIITNPTSQTVTAPTPDGTVVTFPLPEGYTNLQFQEGELGDRYVEVSQGFADTQTVPPGSGEYQVVFAYQLPYDRKLNFIQSMYLPTNAEVVMVPDNGVKVDSAMLQEGGTRDYQDISYRMYNGGTLIAGSALEFTLSGTPRKSAASFFSAGTMQNIAIGLAFFGVALVVAGVWLYRRHQRTLAAETLQGDASLDIPLSSEDAGLEDEETLMDAIIALDDQYHAGNIPEAAYLERRAVLKEKLRKLGQE